MNGLYRSSQIGAGSFESLDAQRTLPLEHFDVVHENLAGAAEFPSAVRGIIVMRRYDHLHARSLCSFEQMLDVLDGVVFRDALTDHAPCDALGAQEIILRRLSRGRYCSDRSPSLDWETMPWSFSLLSGRLDFDAPPLGADNPLAHRTCQYLKSQKFPPSPEPRCERCERSPGRVNWNEASSKTKEARILPRKSRPCACVSVAIGCSLSLTAAEGMTQKHSSVSLRLDLRTACSGKQESHRRDQRSIVGYHRVKNRDFEAL
jgi:hypothetical protein